MKTYCVYLLNDGTNSQVYVKNALHKTLGQSRFSARAEMLTMRVHREGAACVFESENEAKAFEVHQALRGYGLTLVPFGEKPRRDTPKPDYWKPEFGEWRGMDA